jgi:hypothetical protein
VSDREARSAAYWRRLLVLAAGVLGTALIVHACGIHFRDKAPWMATGDLLVWFAFSWAVVR